MRTSSRDQTRRRRFRAIEAVRISTPPETSTGRVPRCTNGRTPWHTNDDPTGRFEVLLARDVSRCKKVCSKPAGQMLSRRIEEPCLT